MKGKGRILLGAHNLRYRLEIRGYEINEDQPMYVYIFVWVQCSLPQDRTCPYLSYYFCLGAVYSMPQVLNMHAAPWQISPSLEYTQIYKSLCFSIYERKRYHLMQEQSFLSGIVEGEFWPSIAPLSCEVFSCAGALSFWIWAASCD